MEVAVRFPANGMALEGLLALPSYGASVGAVVCHPHPLYGGEMHNTVVTALARGLRSAGVATLRFNFRGVGESQGQHDEGRGEVDDVTAAVSFLLSQRTFETVVVAGYSFGAFVGMKAGAQDDRVHKLVGVALSVRSRDVSFLDGVTKPKLLVCGDRDDHAPLAQMQKLAGQLPKPCELVVLPRTDHFFVGNATMAADAAVRFLAP
jgi:alpha/beta superfamily hydrolase